MSDDQELVRIKEALGEGVTKEAPSLGTADGFGEALRKRGGEGVAYAAVRRRSPGLSRRILACVVGDQERGRVRLPRRVA